MPSPDARSNAAQSTVTNVRNRLEIIRFGSREDCRKAIGVLLDRGMLNYSSSVLNEWAVRTDVVQVLRESGVPFEWLTERA